MRSHRAVPAPGTPYPGLERGLLKGMERPFFAARLFRGPLRASGFRPESREIPTLRGLAPQRLVDPHEVVVGDIQRHRGLQVPQPFTVAERQPGEPLEVRPHAQIAALDVRRADLVPRGLAADDHLLHASYPARGVAVLGLV